MLCITWFNNLAACAFLSLRCRFFWSGSWNTLGVIKLTGPSRAQEHYPTKSLKVTEVAEGETQSWKLPSSPGSPIMKSILFPAWSCLGQGLVEQLLGTPHLPPGSCPMPRQHRLHCWGSPFPGSLHAMSRIQIPPWASLPMVRLNPHRRSLMLHHTLFRAEELWEAEAQGHRAVPSPILFRFDSIKLWPFGLLPN